MSETDKCVMDAFTGESKARNKYTFYAELAEKQGRPRIAALFKAAAQAEEIHARRLFNIMLKGKTLEDCLQDAIDGETYEYTDMYPTFKAKAEAEGRKSEAAIFANTAPVEECHSQRYKAALEELKKGVDLGDTGLKVFLCPICGYIEIGTDPQQCPVCKAPASKMIEVN
ncbi:Rubrerythrin [Monocercomonoides exilis]|uniref:Rubrerythrin n=1 Tax=Monocercomonoides exilis TaxID=2049356 RepID=UPI003559961D|nr:Rubrerythrin [Monocercomonoides exilis]|eukprot:MONOS_16811.1-p1 / transcript=MONOS_16811.1 / gene=MONOS_16811 / organism=Monocercomonoides_exilis_PA203 / gene_product=Rubrerythrin / transcript_product=Rubrerythrin / location=Mono_scaffold00283:44822-45448(+) / protein_length=170 / sequence_SO=supercontig / SO=protein_coding / is_pseudo=false